MLILTQLNSLWLLASLVVSEPAPRCRDTTVWLRQDAAPDGTPDLARRLDTWLASTPNLDDELLSPEQIAALNARNVATIGAFRDPISTTAAVMPIEAVDAELKDRLAVMGERVRSGEYVTSPAPPVGDTFAEASHRVENAFPVDRLVALVEPTDLRCIPMSAGLFRGRIDPDFDRNQCSRLHPGDLLRVQRETPDGWLYVRAGHAVGWVQYPTLTPPLTADELSLLSRPHLTLVDDLVPATTTFGDLTFLRLGARFPTLPTPPGEPLHILIPSPSGYTDAWLPPTSRVHMGTPAFTRRRALTLLFDRLGDPYGWGGTHGFRDCSALLLDALAVFDVRLGRNSAVQGLAGSEVIDTTQMSAPEKLAAIRKAHSQGLVFLYMPGHIMVYLGDLGGRPYAISAISEYLLPCPEGGHQTVRIDRVDVTDLNRGEGTERTSFLSRISRLSVFGPP